MRVTRDGFALLRGEVPSGASPQEKCEITVLRGRISVHEGGIVEAPEACVELCREIWLGSCAAAIIAASLAGRHLSLGYEERVGRGTP